MWRLWRKRPQPRYIVRLAIGGKLFVESDMQILKLSTDFDAGCSVYHFFVPAGDTKTPVILSIIRSDISGKN
jgi:hypothetical protein